MKRLLLLAVVVSQFAFAECDGFCYGCLKHNQTPVGPVTNLIEEILVSVGINIPTRNFTCGNGDQRVQKKLKIGEVIWEIQAGPSPVNQYFTYESKNCRMFQEHIVKDDKTEKYNGVICQIKHTNYWRVIDRW